MRMATGLTRAGRHTSPRTGFSLVELLVVISIIGMLMSLLLPAVQQAREAGRSNTCRNNLKNVSLAVLNFESAKRRYPGFRQPLEVTLPGVSAPTNIPVSYIVVTLPYLERTDLYDAWRNPQQAAAAGIAWPPLAWLDVLNCPSGPPPTSESSPCFYVPNSGMLDAYLPVITIQSPPADFKANGVFLNHRIEKPGNPPPSPFGSILNGGPIVYTSQDYLTANDGSSLTFMLCEEHSGPELVPAGTAPTMVVDVPASWGDPSSAAYENFVWWPMQNPPAELTINAPATAPTSSTYFNHFSRPSSNHPSGANVSFCDGHVRFVSNELDYYVYCLLMTPKGSECNTPGTIGGLDGNPGVASPPNVSFYYPNGAHNYKYLRSTPVDESRTQ
jgi:prepilin-type N-terminal cleavage/methylation domain-containing protein/prepilin-type processing-associated H-X9-DG protein